MAEDLSSLVSRSLSEYRTNDTGLAAPDRPESPTQDQTYIGGFLQSALSSIPEFVLGAEPTPGAEVFRQNNFVGGIASQLVSPLGEGAAALKLRSLIPAFDKGVTSFAAKGGNVFTRGGREAVATLAPLEAARVAATAAANPDETGRVATEALFNTGAEFIGGGLFRALTAGGKVGQIGDKIAETGTDLRAPEQLKIRELKSALDSGKVAEDQKVSVLGQISDLEKQIRLEEVGQATPLKLDLSNEGDGREISRLFRDQGTPGGNIRKARLVKSSRDFADGAEKDRVVAASGLDGNWDAVQLPRYVGFAKDQWAKKVSDDLMVRAKMTSVDDRTLMAAEKSGMTVFARKITGDMAEPKATDEWVVWRTDQPGRFVPHLQTFADETTARMSFLRQDNLARDPSRPATIMDELRTAVAQTPIKEFRAAEEKYGKLKLGADKIAETLGMKPGEGGSNFMANRAKALVHQYLTPKLNQFKSSPVAKYIMAHSDRAMVQARTLASKIINGEVDSEAGKSFMKLYGDPDTTGVLNGTRSIKAILKGLTPEDATGLQDVADKLAGHEDYLAKLDDLRASGEISEAQHAAIKDFDKLGKIIDNDLVNHERAANVNRFKPMKAHLMFSRMWDGDYRALIFRKGESAPFYIAGAHSPGEADKLAKALIEKSELSGLYHLPAEQVDAMGDLELARMVQTRSKEFSTLSRAHAKMPVTFKERTGVEGYKKDYTKKQIFDKLSEHVNSRYTYMARLSIDTALEKELAHLSNTDPKMFMAVQERLRQLEGKPGAVGQFINAATDKILKPVMGRNSATKLSAGLNSAVYTLQLGMGNVAFPIMNSLSFMQNVLPELAYVMNAADNRVIRDYYEVMLAGGKDLRPKGSVGVLSPMKLLVKSFGKMREGESDVVYGSALQRAHREGVIDPQMLNDFIGKTSELTTTVSDVMKGEEPLLNLVLKFSSWLPSKSERFSRGNAFTVGYLLGKDVLGLADEPLYQFAKKLTERTMFNYGTADRATLMTGPLGRTFGLFKNWQTHYIFSMLQYADEGYRYGNWAPLMWQMGGTAAVGGVAALPMYTVADGFSRMATDKSLMEQVYSRFGPSNPEGTLGTFSDAVFMGLPAFLGVSLTGNATAPLNDPSRDAAQLMSFPQWDRMRRLGQAAGDAIDLWTQTGRHPTSDPRIRDQFIAALSPKIIAHSMQITKDNALKSLNTGNTLLQNMTLAERLLYMSGITPRRVGLAYEQADELWKNKDARATTTTRYGRMWAEAQQAGDWDKIQDLWHEAMVLGLDVGSITKSANAVIQKQSTGYLAREASPETLGKLREMGMPGF